MVFKKSSRFENVAFFIHVSLIESEVTPMMSSNCFFVNRRDIKNSVINPAIILLIICFL